MNFEEYQKESRKTAVYKDAGSNIIYPTLGLSGESGEVAEKVKKMIRDGSSMDEERKQGIEGELGDVLWYISQIASELGSSLDEIARKNIEKLRSRQERGILHKGTGDNR